MKTLQTICFVFCLFMCFLKIYGKTPNDNHVNGTSNLIKHKKHSFFTHFYNDKKGVTLPPSVSISAEPGEVIELGTSVTFSAIVSDIGEEFTYQWQKNNKDVGTDAAIYIDDNLKNDDIILCIVTNKTTGEIGFSNTITITVILPETSVIISASKDAICKGTPVVFTAIPTNGGSTPAYQWQKNDSNVGTNAAIYTDNNLQDGDVITCIMTSNLTNIPVLSNAINIFVEEPSVPFVSIVTDESSIICTGKKVVFTAEAINTGGGSITYNFKTNDILVQSGPSNIYENKNLKDGDIVKCEIDITDGICLSTKTAVSNEINIAVLPLEAPSVKIKGNSIICNGETAIFEAEALNTGGGTIFYQFKINNESIQEDITNILEIEQIKNGDIITCSITITDGLCLASETAKAEPIMITVTEPINPSVILTNESGAIICEGQSALFKAKPINTGDAAIVYIFKINNEETQINTDGIFETKGLVDGDEVICEINIVDGNCLKSDIAVSNPLRVSVRPYLTPSVSIFASAASICSGATVIFTPIPVNGGTNPKYVWKKNNIQVATTPTYTTNSLQNGDMVTCEMASSETCLTKPIAISNAVAIKVTSVTQPVTIQGNTSICRGDSTVLTASAGVNYIWSTGATTPSVTVGIGGIYSITVTNVDGCQSIANTLVEVKNFPEITIAKEQKCEDIILRLITSGEPRTDLSYEWSNGSRRDTAVVQQNGTYYATVTDISKICRSIDTIKVIKQFTKPILTPPVDFLNYVEVRDSFELIPYEIIGHSICGKVEVLSNVFIESFTDSIIVKRIWVGVDTRGITSDTLFQIINVKYARKPAFAYKGKELVLQKECNVLENPTNFYKQIFWVDTNRVTRDTIFASSYIDAANFIIFVNDTFRKQIPINVIPDLEKPKFTSEAIPQEIDVLKEGFVMPNYNITATDNCGEIILRYSENSDTIKSTGLITITRSWTVTDAAGNNSSISQTIYLREKLSGKMIYTPSKCGEPAILELQLIGIRQPSILWNTLDISNFILTPKVTGQYSVSVTEGGQQIVFSQFVVIPTKLAVTINAPTTCDSVLLTANTSGGTGNISYIWSTVQSDKVILVKENGTYIVTVTDGNGCTATTMRTVQLGKTPIVTLIGKTSFCTGDSTVLIASGGTNYQWSTGSISASITVKTAGNYAVSVSNGGNCTTTMNRTIVVNPIPIVKISGDTVICSNKEINIIASGGVQYEWSTGAKTDKIIVNQEGSYTVTVTNQEGCSAKTKHNVVSSIDTLSSIAIKGNESFCEGTGSILTATGGVKYIWSTGDTSAQIRIKQNGIYSVLAYNRVGCSQIAEKKVTMYEKPKAGFVFDNTSVTTVSFKNTSTGSAYFKWDFGNGTTSVDENPTVIYANTGIYNVTLIISSKEGCADTIKKEIKVGIVSAFDLQQGLTIKISPNPFSDHISVSIEADMAKFNIKLDKLIIQDVVGSILLQKTIDNYEANFINTATLLRGTYIVSVLSKNRQFIIGKLVKVF